jgi:succinate dehydrogenase / fumarate reductase cytochrome b subunit
MATSPNSPPRARPLSPHLGIYRWQWTMALSILHRITGVGLALGTLLLVYWLVSAAMGPAAYAGAQGFLKSWIGLVLLFGWTLALFYHLFNGIRHLVWDAGKGFDLAVAERTAWLVVAATAGASVLVWILAFAR